MHDRRTFMKAHGIQHDVPEEERLQRYLAIPEEVRHVFEREEVRQYFVELDQCHGSCVLRHAGAAQVVAEALNFHHGRTLHRSDFVVMPNHVHAIITPITGNELEGVLKSVKSYSARCINRIVGRTGRLWQAESHDHIIRNDNELYRIRAYIESNPAKAKLRIDDDYYFREES